ncbi:RidA family protein [Flammeovirga kamogawensis]|uniref:RidA family protein n=1 Tax=Flammeovirga kamogawensis TaxID=373891 RepID=A0ABX8GRK5_9BACT|nr:hypothetical protein [Flammeovirga kamogawensis]MBB6462738.1 enamine deaminase RidA (YjgF/YER057c/UK114 family) [Flammeovirga kamogawensis]QWG06029.1 hypothetical protein KM029_11720 [Flammeovirga kamogawensis]TRX67861.1 hypothetical protein EO216_06740 [Flammeovirga kamogawensis]
MKKTVFNTENLNEMPWFNHGMHLQEVKEFFRVTGICDHTSKHVQKYPNDPAGQAKQILIYMEEVFTQAGFNKNNIIHIDWAVTKEVSQEQAFETLKVWEDYISDMDMKPTAGIWKHVDSLIHPDMLVEFELILAK